MLITYTCPKCNAQRFLTKVKDEVECKECGTIMNCKRDNPATGSLTTEEARFMADEALYNTIGDRIAGVHRARHL